MRSHALIAVGLFVCALGATQTTAAVLPLTLTAADFSSLGTLQPVGGWPAATTTMTGTKLRGDVTHQVFLDTVSSDYFYLYQVENAGTDASWHIIEVFTLTPFTGADGSTQVGYLTANEPPAFVDGTVVPSGSSVDTLAGPTISFNFPGFLSNPIPVGQTSEVLYVRSALPPARITGNIINGGIADGVVVGPVPEPATLGLLALGGLAIVMRRKRTATNRPAASPGQPVRRRTMKPTMLACLMLAVALLPIASAGAQPASSPHYVMPGPVAYPGSELTLQKMVMVPDTGLRTTVTASGGGGQYHVDSFFDVFTELDLPPGSYHVDSFFDVFTELSLPEGQGLADSFFDVFVEIEITVPPPPGLSEPLPLIPTEIIALDLTGGGGGGATYDLRKRPGRASTGGAQRTDLGGGDFSVDSFFDVFTELSVDGGATWLPGTVSDRPDIPGRMHQVNGYSIIKDPQNVLYGNLNQNSIPNGGQHMCGPTAAVNSFIYLQNAYPAVFNSHLVAAGAAGGADLDGDGNVDSYDDMIAVAQTLAMPHNMNTKVGGAGGSAGTWADMFTCGKMNYIETQTTLAPGTTVYAAQMTAAWQFALPARPADEIPPIPRPAWVQDNTIPTWQFLYNQLQSCEDVELLIVDDYDWGHFLTATGFVWSDTDGDMLIDLGEAMLHYVDPATGMPGVSPISQAAAGAPLFVTYGTKNAQVVMVVSESVPEPATLMLLAFGGLAAVRQRRR